MASRESEPRPVHVPTKSEKEREFEPVPNDPESARRVAAGIGAAGNILFLMGGRRIRVIEFPDTGPKASLLELAERDPQTKAFLQKIGTLIEDCSEVDVPESLAAFNNRNAYPLAYDVRP